MTDNKRNAEQNLNDNETNLDSIFSNIESDISSLNSLTKELEDRTTDEKTKQEKSNYIVATCVAATININLAFSFFSFQKKLDSLLVKLQTKLSQWMKSIQKALKIAVQIITKIKSYTLTVSFPVAISLSLCWER